MNSRVVETKNASRTYGVILALMLGLCALVMTSCQMQWARAAADSLEDQNEPETSQTVPDLIIESDPELPEAFPRTPYEFRFQARGGVPVLHWRVEKGMLPRGLKLEDDGLLHGHVEHTGEFQFTISVRDGGKPQQAVQKGFTLRVRSALTLSWKTPAHVIANRIEGIVEVSNATPDDMDLTFIVVAILPNGRATAIGYQHFTLQRGGVPKDLPFGDTLPPGAYAIHVDAVGEVDPTDLIYRERLDSPSALQVTVGP